MTRIAIDPARSDEYLAYCAELGTEPYICLAEVLLREATFDGPARIRTVTAARPGDARTLPDVETAQLEEGSEHTKDGMVAVRLPPQSFTVIEAAMTNSG